MADISFSSTPIAPSAPRAQGPLRQFFAAIRTGFAMNSVANSRMHQIEMLNALSDEELSARGLSREAIPRYVFRDLIGF